MKWPMKLAAQVFVSYLLVLILAFLLYMQMYAGAVELLEKRQTEIAQNNVVSLCQRLESGVLRMDDILYDIAVNANIVSSAGVDAALKDPRDILRLTRAREALAVHADASPLFTQLYLFFDNGVILCSDTAIHTRPRWFYDHFVFSPAEEKPPYAEWEAFLGQNYAHAFVCDAPFQIGAERNADLYLHTIHTPLLSGVSITAAYVLDRAAATAYLQEACPDGDGLVLLMDRAGTVLYQYGSDAYLLDFAVPGEALSGKAEYDGAEYLISSAFSAASGLRAVSFTPCDRVFGDLYNLQRVMTVLLIAFCLLGLGIGALFTLRNTFPVMRIALALDRFVGDKSARTPYQQIERGVNYLMEENQRLDLQYQKQQDIVKSMLLTALLSGNMLTPEETETLLQMTATDFPHPHFSALHMRLARTAEGAGTLPDINGLLAEAAHAIRLSMPEAVVYFHAFDFSRIVALINHAATPPRFPDPFLPPEREEGVAYFIGVGDSVNDIRRIPASQRQAERAIETLENEQRLNALATHASIQAETQEFALPPGFIQQAVNLIRGGYAEETERLFADAIRAMFTRRLRSNAMYDMALYQFLSVVTDVVSGMPDPPFGAAEAEKIMLSTRPNRHKAEELKAAAVSLASAYAGRRNVGGRLKERMNAYLQAHFRSESCSAAEAARALGITPSYFSTMFKELFGQQFSSLLEAMRTDWARRLLEDDRLTIAEVAAQSGYANVYTFRRAFKRITALSPSEYRQQHGGGKPR